MEMPVGFLLGQAFSIISKIRHAVQLARENKKECHLLADRLHTLETLIYRLPARPGGEHLLAQMNATLQEAHGLVVSCGGLLRAKDQAKSFDKLNGRIDSHIGALNLHLSVCIFDAVGCLQANAVPSTSASQPSSQIHWEEAAGEAAQVYWEAPTWELAWKDLLAATNYFSDVLGAGSSGTVYGGKLQGGVEVAVKVLKNGTQRVEDAFMAEIEILSPLRHENVLRLLAWCVEGERVLVYERAAKGSFRNLLSGANGCALSWKIRVKVLLGLSRAIEYLHLHANPPIIHRDVSSSNVLLDSNWAPRLAGFGAAVFQATRGEHGGQLVDEVIGSIGYIDPVYAETKVLSQAVDLHGLGMVMLEAVTGRPPVSGDDGMTESLADTVRNGHLHDVMVFPAWMKPTSTQMVGLEMVANTAERCMWADWDNRPRITEVIENLQTAMER